jgi:prepilin-type processing-associated H-X9-DG protein
MSDLETTDKPPVLLTLFGGFRMQIGSTAAAAAPRKAEALLTYLAMQDGYSAPREAILDLLWTDRGIEQARHSLRQAMFVLRRIVGAGVFTDDARAIGIVPTSIRTDVGEFRTLVGSPARSDLAVAAQLYTGPLLGQFPSVAAEFDQWLERARSDLTSSAIELLARLSHMCFADGHVAVGVSAAERMLALDPLREDSHRALMLAYQQAGRRADAIRQSEICRNTLRREWDSEPSPETEALIAQIRSESRTDESRQVVAQRELPANLFAQASSGPPRLAVLPFRTFGPDAVPTYFAAGIVDDIITLLAGVREPIVVSSGSSSLYRDRPFDLCLVGQELGVRYVVSGSARYSSPMTRISVSLAEVESGVVLWAHSYDARDMTLFDAQDDIAQRVVNTIIPHIHESEMRRLRNKKPKNMSAYDLVLQARDLMFRLDQSDYQEAGTLLQRAITMDPAYATAHALLADWFALRIGQGWSPAPEADSIASDRAARDAIAWDSLNARALSLHANTRSFLHRDYEGAMQLLDKAIDIAPNDASSWMWSAGTFAYVDRGAEAVRRAEQAIRLSPRDRFAFRFYTALCLAHYTNGSYDAAVDWGARAVREAPKYTASLRFMIASLVANGQISTAREVGQELLKLQPEFRVSSVRERHPYRDAARRNRIADELRLAGLPE